MTEKTTVQIISDTKIPVWRIDKIYQFTILAMRANKSVESVKLGRKSKCTKCRVAR